MAKSVSVIQFALLTGLAAIPCAAQKTIPVISLGTRSLVARPAGTAGSSTINLSSELRAEPDDEALAKAKAGFGGQARVPASGVPAPASRAVTSSNPGLTSFDGLTHLDQRLADLGNQFSLEPPDQGLAVGNGYVVEAINTALAVYDTSGNLITGPVALNPFFGLASEIDRNANPTVYGPFTSDPRVYFDSQTGRFYVTLLEIDVNSATGDLGNKSHVLLAVSKTSNPTGAWSLFSIDTTDDGTNATTHPSCPCFGDQPLMGADANALVITTNEFPIVGDGFNGAQVYVLSKSQLAAGTLGSVTFFDNLGLAEGQAYSLQPAVTPPGGAFETRQGGTEYLLSALDFNGTRDNRIAVWALTQTSSIDSATPALQLGYKVLASEVYGQPPAAQQPDGVRPLAQVYASLLLGVKTPPIEKTPLLDTNDDRMNQVVYAAGKLWGAVNTVIKPSNGATTSGIAYFAVTPSVDGSGVSGTVSSQGYIAVSEATVMFPSIAVNNSGKGVMTFTLAGTGYLPSAAYVFLDANGASDVHIARPGAWPADGFTGYTFAGKPTRTTERWGDYSAASVDETGNVWFATEYTTALPRTVLANWGTAIGKIKP